MQNRGACIAVGRWISTPLFTDTMKSKCMFFTFKSFDNSHMHVIPSKTYFTLDLNSNQGKIVFFVSAENSMYI